MDDCYLVKLVRRVSTVSAVALGMACGGGGLGPVGPGVSAGKGNAGGAGGGGCLEGSESCPCYPNQTCDGSLSCVSHVCVDLGGGGAPSAGGSTSVGGRAGGNAAVGGAPPTGGTALTGGTATGGTDTGGQATGGTSAGGMVTGGTSTGGSSGGEPCSPATDQIDGNCREFGTTGAVCLRTSATILGWGCTNFGSRTVQVNNVSVSCGDPTLPTRWTDGYYYFSVSAGEYSYACIFWW